MLLNDLWGLVLETAQLLGAYYPELEEVLEQTGLGHDYFIVGLVRAVDDGALVPDSDHDPRKRAWHAGLRGRRLAMNGRAQGRRRALQKSSMCRRVSSRQRARTRRRTSCPLARRETGRV